MRTKGRGRGNLEEHDPTVILQRSQSRRSWVAIGLIYQLQSAFEAGTTNVRPLYNLSVVKTGMKKL